MREIRRILFIRTDRIGDVLLNLPAIRLLRQTFPKAWLTLLCDLPLGTLLNGHPDIDEVMAVDKHKLESDGSERRALIRKVHKARFDLAVVSNPHRYLHWLVFRARIPHRIGYARKWGFLLTKRLPAPGPHSVRHEIERNLDLASLASDRAWDGQIELPLDERARALVGTRLDAVGKSVVAIHPGTSNPAKRWPSERFAELCDWIQTKTPHRVVLIGGEEERTVSLDLKRRLKHQAINWTGTLSLKELAAFFKNPNVRALVSSDSGPVHVAWISGTPAVVFYAKNVPGSSPDRWGPRDKKSTTIYKSMDAITAEEAFAALRRTLEIP